MSLISAIHLTAGLMGIILFINAFEMLFILKNRLFYNVWKYELLKDELTTHLPLPQLLTGFIFSDKNFRFVPKIQICLTILLIFKVNLWLVLSLLILHLVICIRFRGTFNGGSDMMVVVVLTGLSISLIEPQFQKAGMIYITIHSIFSYFKAGLVKFRSKDWRQGIALKFFLERSRFEFIKRLASQLNNRPRLNLFLCWFVISFELSVILLLFIPQLKAIYLVGALIFHLLISFCFGLNRFFWSWLAAWPAIFYSLTLLQ